MSEDKKTVSETIDRLTDIVQQLQTLGSEAKQLIRDLPASYRSIYDRAMAYDACSFGTSSNQYDVTLDVLIGEIETRHEESTDEESE